MKGYQFDLDGRRRYDGNNYEEKGRLFLAVRGQMSHVVGGRPPVVLSSFATSDELATVPTSDWNAAHLIVRGNMATHILNGRLMSITIDDDAPNRKLDGSDRHAGARRPADEDRVSKYSTEALVTASRHFATTVRSPKNQILGVRASQKSGRQTKRRAIPALHLIFIHRNDFSCEVGMYHRHQVLLLAAVLFLGSVSVNAQVTTATLVGLVRDNSAAVIPGASVLATHEGTGVTREGVSDANGEFVLAALPSGPYTLRIELTGFKTISQRGIQLGAGQTVRQTFVLEVGAMSETVTVTGEAPLVRDGNVAADRQPRVAGGT